jgi:hypothetical protein
LYPGFQADFSVSDQDVKSIVSSGYGVDDPAIFNQEFHAPSVSGLARPSFRPVL